MKILVFYPYVPYPLDRGTYQRTFHLLRELAREHTVDLLALTEHGEGLPHKPVFEEFCRRVEIIPFEHPEWQKLFPHRLLNPLPSNVAHWSINGVAGKVERMLQLEKYDLIHACDIVLAQFVLPFSGDIPIAIDRSRVDLQFQLAEHDRMNFSLREKLLRYEGYLKLWFYEKSIANRAAMEIVCGPDDEVFLRRHVNPDMPAQVLVNGVDLDYFNPSASLVPKAISPTILFCGAMDYNPNIDALRWYFSEIHDPLVEKIPDLQMLIVGKNPTEEIKSFGQKKNVMVTGTVPDVRPYYRRAWMQIVPLRIGGGSRLKIVESLAIGTPVVSTTIGAQGLGLTHDSDVLLADTTADFVNETARALNDETLRHTLMEKGIESVRSRLSWKMLGKQLSELYKTRFSATQDEKGNGQLFSPVENSSSEAVLK